MNQDAQSLSAVRRRFVLWGAGLAISMLALSTQAAEVLPLAELAKPGRLLMLRHANAPGIGDPPGFKIDKCSTQRLLDAAGRAQAVDLGKRLARAGVAPAKLYSSQWCRCLETARLLNLGAPVELPALNSFFQRSAAREAQLAEMRQFISRLPTDAPLVVMVTHQVMISAFSGEGIASGAGAVFELVAGSSPRLIGEIAAQ